MIEHRPLDSLGGGNHGWLRAKLHFDIGGSGNPDHRAIGPLVAWNDDEFAPGGGFPLHPHRDLEIITYVREGAITHEDNLGNKGHTRAGDVQVMSTGAGILHSEFNREDAPTRLYQIWIRSRSRGGTPRWANRSFPRSDRSGRFAVLASGDRADADALPINADARLLGVTLTRGETITHQPAGARGYIVPATGRIELNETRLDTRDGAAFDGEAELTITALEDSEIVLVELL